MTTLDRLPTSCILCLPGFEIRITRSSMRGLGRCIAVLALWHRRLEGRRSIRAMTSEHIRDLDLDCIALHREAEKPFWRA